MTRWKVQNMNYGWTDMSGKPQPPSKDFTNPWFAIAPAGGFHEFATHAEAITYATSKAQEDA